MNSIKIDIIDNGFILSYVKNSALSGKPSVIVQYVATMKEISDILNKEF